MESTMDPKLLKAFKIGDMNKINQLVASENIELFQGRTPQGNTALHLAARLKFRRVVIDKILPRFERFVLYERNRNGETPMHIAAKAGNASVIEAFFEYDKDRIVSENGQNNILWMRDNNGNTPLHNAVGNHHDWEAILLIKKLPLTLLSVNDAKQSPLFIAVDTGATYIAWFIISRYQSVLDRIRPNDLTLLHSAVINMRRYQSFLDHIGPNDLTLLHSAVINQNCVIMVEILKRREDLIYKVDELNMNPLHHVAVSGDMAIARRLLEADASSSLGYKVDCNGQTPLHLAAKNGRTGVLRMLLNEYPASIEVLDQRHRNILHLAAQNGKKNTIGFILTLPEMEDLINSPDIDGNTPLHLAAMNSHRTVVYILAKGASVNIKATKLEQETALAIIQSPQSHERDIEKEQEREMAQVILVMATLIVTFTFTAALTLPGGYKDVGTAKLDGKPGFKTFVICITIAMTSGMSAAVLALGQILFKNHERLGNVNLVSEAIGLIYIGLLSMSVAFMTGLYVVLLDKLALAITVVSISCAFLLLLMLVGPFFQKSDQLRTVDLLSLLLGSTFTETELYYRLESRWLRRYDRIMISMMNSGSPGTIYFINLKMSTLLLREFKMLGKIMFNGTMSHISKK